MRSLAVGVVLLTVGPVACHRAAVRRGVDDAAAPTRTAPSAAVVPVAQLSRPRAAARLGDGLTVVVGVRAGSHTLAAVGLGATGELRWSRDILSDIEASANASVTALRLGDGAFVVWRGMRGAAQAALGVRLAADGTVAGEPARVGAAACTTASSAAWVERGAGGAWAVNGLSGSRASASTLFTVSEDRDPVLLCAERTVFALGDGDDDVTLQWAGSAGAPASARVIGPRDFRGDDERLHEGYAAGDTVGVVRIGTGGSVAVREVSDGHASSWRRLTHRLAESDDVDALDADPTVGVLAFSRDANPDGEGKGAGVVDALVWGRAPGGAEGSWKLADADPQAVRGPFASGAVSGGVAVAWVERGVEERKASESPVRLAYRLVALAGPGPLGRVDGPFVDILDAGCDGARCYAVGFRPSSDDGGAPGATLDVIAYP